MTDTELNHANKAVFEIMFPIMMFYNIYSADFSGVIIPRYIAFCVVMLFIVYGPVSYTHLDVYKRQASNCLLLRIPEPTVISEFCTGKQKQFTERNSDR